MQYCAQLSIAFSKASVWEIIGGSASLAQAPFYFERLHRSPICSTIFDALGNTLAVNAPLNLQFSPKQASKHPEMPSNIVG